MRDAGRRGVAMLLVLVAMVVAVVLTSAAIVSRETSPMMGANATSSVSAAWSAESAANYAVGVLAHGFDWSSAIGPDGTLVDSMVVGDATVHVVLTDLDGNVPDANDRDLYMIATATVGGIETTVRRMISLGEAVDPIDAIDPMLGEFALFGTGNLVVSSGATLGVWQLSPEALARPDIKLGTSFQQPSNFNVSLDAAQGPVSLFADKSGDSGLIAKMESMLPNFVWQVPLTIPTLAMGVPSAVMVGLPSVGDYDSPNGAVANLTIANFGRIRIQNNATITINGTTPVAIRCDRLEMDSAMLRIVGDVSIFVRDRTRVENNSKIVLADPDSSLKIYVCDEFEVDGGSQVGVVQSDSGKSVASLGTWVNPVHVQILEVSVADGGTGASTYLVQGGATLLATVHAPSGDVTITGGSVLIGRATGDYVQIDSGSSVFYDPTLDNRVGFTNNDGPMFESDGTAKTMVEQAIDDALASSGNDAGMFMTLVRDSYDTLALVGGDLSDAVGGMVQQTMYVFSDFFGGH